MNDICEDLFHSDHFISWSQSWICMKPSVGLLMMLPTFLKKLMGLKKKKKKKKEKKRYSC